jgi:hypothetical protein
VDFPSVQLIRSVPAGLEDGQPGEWLEYLGAVQLILEGMIRALGSWPVSRMTWQRQHDFVDSAGKMLYEFRMPHAPARSDHRTALYVVRRT